MLEAAGGRATSEEKRKADSSDSPGMREILRQAMMELELEGRWCCRRWSWMRCCVCTPRTPPRDPSEEKFLASQTPLGMTAIPGWFDGLCDGCCEEGEIHRKARKDEIGLRRRPISYIMLTKDKEILRFARNDGFCQESATVAKMNPST